MKQTHTYTELMRREGFWWSEYEPLLPFPEKYVDNNPWEGKEEFLAALRVAQDKAESKLCRGWSNCRICDCRNGSVTFELNGWRWPSGYYHYIKEHNIRPSLAFQEFILGHHVGKK